MAEKIGGSISNLATRGAKFLIGVFLAVSTTFTISRKGAALMPFGRENVGAWLYNIQKSPC